MHKFKNNSLQAISGLFKIVFFIIVFSSGQSCKQYEDDTFLTFLPPGQRISGKWELNEVFKQKDDFTDLYKDTNPYEFIDYRYNETYEIFANDSSISYGIWLLSEDKSKLLHQPVGEYVEYEFDILRLQHNHFWVRTYDDFFQDSLEFRFVRHKE